MPELPEVETVRQTLRSYVLDKEIESVEVLYPKIIEGDVEAFKQMLIHKRIREIERYGKYLIFILDDCAFLSHLRMEGKYFVDSSDTPYDRHTHVLFHFSDHSDLRYHDTRKFGRISLCSLDYMSDPHLSKLGDEPFTVDEEALYRKFHKSHLSIKQALLDQSFMCGIGNIYANEICFRMGIHPHSRVDRLSKKRVKQLKEVSILILNKAIEKGGSTIHSFSSDGIDGMFQNDFNVYNKEYCPICGNRITKEMYKGRGTYYCKKCQDRRY